MELHEEKAQSATIGGQAFDYMYIVETLLVRK